jgi:endoglucanase
MKRLLTSALFVTMFLTLSGCSESTPVLLETQVAVSSRGITVDVVAKESWSSGYNGAIKVTNNGFGATITAFEVGFRLNTGAGINSPWVGTITGSGPYLAANPSWVSIAAGQTFEMGFAGTGSFTQSTITSLKVNGQTIPLGTSGDTTKPTVSLQSSSSNITTAGSITLTAAATDNVGVSKVEFFDSSTLIGTDTASPYTKSVTFVAGTSGTKNFTAKASDAAGNSQTSSRVTVTYNIPGTPPPPPSGFYVDPNSSPLQWANANPNDSKASLIRNKIGNVPMARWFTFTSGIQGAVDSFVDAATAAGKIALMVAYNIPGRDCGQHSSGGAGSPDAYKTWINEFAAGIGNRKAYVILEPDALPLVSGCANSTNTVTSLLSYAVDKFKAVSPNAKVYLDAGHSAWRSVDDISNLLSSAGVARAAGFSLNTSNYQTTASSKTYGDQVSSSLGGAKYVIDTSRNGNGPNGGEWCNPSGRKIGAASALVNQGALEAYLWVKIPGESDGNCGIGIGSSAGQFLPQAAYDMAK